MCSLFTRKSSSYTSGFDDCASIRDSKLKKVKDACPRKHSQHTKGNKLWEFIRDALKDPVTCPSIVRWEDPIEGVFRIVESEKLARLWGERKNNTKMTYEKLSRAMSAEELKKRVSTGWADEALLLREDVQALVEVIKSIGKALLML
ncbi:Ets-domain protein [Cooperia oncophora]